MEAKMTNADTEKTLVIGGCRSGKSSHAMALAESIGRRRLFIATCVPHDDEMQARVRRHQQERNHLWETLEVPVDVADAISDRSPSTDVILVDCLTLWMSNLLMQALDEEQIRSKIDQLALAVKKAPHPVILVSNEVGTGIVPDNQMARLYRDLTGWSNQAMAEACDRVIWTVAGIPVTIKPNRSGIPS